jgi:RNA polymerase sigma-70 factor (ECF subfamily)
MASVATPGPVEEQPSLSVQEFVARRYNASGAEQFGMDRAAFAAMLGHVITHACPVSDAEAQGRFLESLRIDELVLARACAAGNEDAWQVFLNRYRNTLYESAYKIASTESTARELADSLYAELYGVGAKGQQRTSKLLYYQGRGSLQGWLRVVVAQEYINRYRSVRRESSLDAAVEDGAQFTAPVPDVAVADPRVEAAVTAELATLNTDERFLLVAYFLDHRTLAEIAKLKGVHESTISRRLERLMASSRKSIRKRMIQAGISARQADEALADVDVRDLRVAVRETLQQDSPAPAFYQEKGEPQG